MSNRLQIREIETPATVILGDYYTDARRRKLSKGSAIMIAQSGLQSKHYQNSLSMYEAIRKPYRPKNFTRIFDVNDYVPSATMAYAALRFNQSSQTAINYFEKLVPFVKKNADSTDIVFAVHPTASEITTLILAHNNDFPKVTNTFSSLMSNSELIKLGIRTPEAYAMLTSLTLLTDGDYVINAVKQIIGMKKKWEDDQTPVLLCLASRLNQDNFEATFHEWMDIGNSPREKELKINEFTQKGKSMLILAEKLGMFSREEVLKRYAELLKIKKIDDWGALRLLLADAANQSNVGLTTGENWYYTETEGEEDGLIMPAYPIPGVPNMALDIAHGRMVTGISIPGVPSAFLSIGSGASYESEHRVSVILLSKPAS